MARRASSTLTDLDLPASRHAARPADAGRVHDAELPAMPDQHVSTASRVVPGVSLTIIRSSRSNRLTSDDLPAFGRPTIAIDTSRPARLRASFAAPSAASASTAALDSRGVPQALDDRVQQIADAFAVLGGNLEHRVEAKLIEIQRARSRRDGRRSC